MNSNIIKFTIATKESSKDDSFVASEHITRNVIGELYRAGCRYDNVKNAEEHFSFLFETIRSTYLLSKGVSHPIQTAIYYDLFNIFDD